MTHHTTPLMVQSLVWIIMNISTKENQIINTKLLYIVIHTFIPWFGIYKYLDFLEFYGNFMKEFDILDMGFSTHLFSLADFGGFDKTKISISPPVIHHLKITQPMKTGFFFFFFLKYHPYLWTCSDPFTYPIKKIKAYEDVFWSFYLSNKKNTRMSVFDILLIYEIWNTMHGRRNIVQPNHSFGNLRTLKLPPKPFSIWSTG